MLELLLGLALAMTIEGALYTLFPDAMKRMMRVLLGQSSGSIRAAGLALAVAGVGLAWLIKG